MIYDHFNKNGYYPSLFGRELTSDEIEAVVRSASQSIDMYDICKEAEVFDYPYAKQLYGGWIAGEDEPFNRRNAFQQIIDVGQSEPAVPLPVPVPDGGLAPQQSGFVGEKIPGRFFMCGKGNMRGTYRPAKFFNGEKWISFPNESVYQIYDTVFTTECPAQVIGFDGKSRLSRPEPNSLGFEIQPVAGGLAFFTLDDVNAHGATIYRTTDNCLTWSSWVRIAKTNGQLLNSCSDGTNIFFYGHEDRYPFICDANGNRVLKMSEPGWEGNQISYAVVKDGLWTLGLECIDPYTKEGDKRNAYTMHWNGPGTPYIVGVDLHTPFPMDMKIAPDGTRIVASSVWNETGYPSAELAISKNGKTDWKIYSVPMPSVVDIELVIVDGVLVGVKCYGGLYGQWGAVYAVKL